MRTIEQVALDLTALGFVALGIAATLRWYRWRGRAPLMLALSLSLLGVVAILGRVQALIGSAPWLASVNVVAFLACGYFVLLFRDAFLPLRRRTIWAATGLLVVSSLLGVAVVTVLNHAPIGIVTASSLVLVLTWGLFIGEPIVRFWIASGTLPSVQRNRMRTLSFGFAVLIAVLLAAVVGGSAIQSPGGTIAIQLIALAMVPVIWVSVAPPTILRNIWRMSEQSKLRAAIQDLLMFSPNPRVLAEQAVGWAMRLLGAHAAFIVDPEGKVMARRNVSETAIRDIMHRHSAGGVPTGPEGSPLLMSPLPLTEGTGYLGVIAGPFTPFFGSDEIGQLDGYATSVAAGIERTRVTERMATIEKHKSQFLNLASHELRGPMTVIRGYGSMLQSGMLGDLNERGRKAAEVMMAKITEMNGMVEQMIEAARLEDESLIIKPQEADLREIARAAVERIRPLIDESHRLKVHVPRAAVPVKVDSERIQTIVTNLIENAAKYSPDGGDVTCTVTMRGGIARVAVKDGGVGITPADMPILFTRFGRISNPRTNHLPGTGLGLYLGRQLARLHGGDITVDSADGVGSTFTLHLPALVPQPVQAPQPAERTEATI
ncbi:MAG TPA: HAMP domain-containing sensor histidine kinase [Candidatus Dormibacteraeota bacterium]|nr:HAMP domain-containing sensor histidine kinase [Candidatus Dormibacteraeota bacterium]